MKLKAVSGIMLSLLLIGMLTLAFNIQTIEAEPEVRVYLDPEVSHAAIGQTFSVNISIANVTDLYGYEFKLFWNNTLLNCIQTVNTPPAGWNYVSYYPGLQQNYNSTHARYHRGVCAFPPSTPFDGGTILAILTFQVLEVGDCVLDLCDVILGDSSAEVIEDWNNKDSPDDGYFEYTPLQHDVAVFLDSPMHIIPGNSVLLNATVFNGGLDNETNVELRLLINGSMVSSTVVSFLEVGSSQTLSYLWTTSTLEAIYNVTTYVPPIPDEGFTLNNMGSVRAVVSHVIRVPIHYPAIQEAIDAANPGDTILVSKGIYYEHLTVDKSLTLAGEEDSPPIIDGNGTGTVVLVKAHNVYIGGFEIQSGIYGIWLLDESSTNMIKNNKILKTLTGTFSAAHDTTVIGNTFLDNYNALDSYGSGITVYHNNFINSTIQVHSVGSEDVWDNGCEGNYWSDYNGTDLDGDGIGDTLLPYHPFDNYPLMSPYTEGDVNHDAIVNILDGVIIAVAFGTEPGDPKWNPHADLNEDGIINIQDILLWAIHFGETY